MPPLTPPSKTRFGDTVFGTFIDMNGATVGVMDGADDRPSLCWLVIRGGQMPNPAPHMNIAQARQLITLLNRFICDAQKRPPSHQFPFDPSEQGMCHICAFGEAMAAIPEKCNGYVCRECGADERKFFRGRSIASTPE